MERREAVYRTRDHLRNFRIRVQLNRVSAGGGGGRSFSRASNTGPQDVETYTFRWQEKVFSQREEELFADALNCTSALEMRYHRDILTLRSEGGRQNNRLFCYTEGDQLPLSIQAEQQLIQSAQGYQTFAAQFGSVVRRRHVGRRKGTTSNGENPVLEHPSMEQRLSHRIITPPSQSMYIMADLHKSDQPEDIEEHILCHIKVDSHGVVSVQPDFNSGRPAYRVETKSGEVYEYHLEHVSETLSPEEKEKEERIHSELYHRHTSHLQSCVGTEFTDPPEGNALHVLLLGEIVSAQGFQYDDLYVTAHLELPDFWELSDEKELSVVTQLSRSKSKHLYNIAYFNCPFEYDITYHSLAMVEDELPQWPKVVVAVASLDRWDRHRMEGYGYLTLPARPGMYDLPVETWRPTGRRVVDRLSRFFVGGGPELSDISYITQPKDFEGTHLSKYGFRTETSGTVNFRFNIVHHSSVMAQRFQSEQLLHAVSRHKGVRSSLAATLDAFQRARQRAASMTTTLH